MITLVVLFNLRDPAAASDYEAWAKSIDQPTVTRLPSIGGFELLRARGMLGGAVAPYQYLEIIRIRDEARFTQDIATARMQEVAAQFQAFAKDPMFIVTEPL